MDRSWGKISRELDRDLGRSFPPVVGSGRGRVLEDDAASLDWISNPPPTRPGSFTITVGRRSVTHRPEVP